VVAVLLVVVAGAMFVPNSQGTQLNSHRGDNEVDAFDSSSPPMTLTDLGTTVSFQHVEFDASLQHFEVPPMAMSDTLLQPFPVLERPEALTDPAQETSA
jgi:hypothetical protein